MHLAEQPGRCEMSTPVRVWVTKAPPAATATDVRIWTSSEAGQKLLCRGSLYAPDLAASIGDGAVEMELVSVEELARLREQLTQLAEAAVDEIDRDDGSVADGDEPYFECGGCGGKCIALWDGEYCCHGCRERNTLRRVTP